jgi:16S rRNA (adenine1518-N6/adenine1519-N6)-dimethyltransferase
VSVTDEKLFNRVVRGAFAQRRKTLLNSLRGSGFPQESLAEKIIDAGIDPKRRGETLTLEEFCTLAAALAFDPN